MFFGMQMSKLEENKYETVRVRLHGRTHSSTRRRRFQVSFGRGIEKTSSIQPRALYKEKLDSSLVETVIVCLWRPFCQKIHCPTCLQCRWCFAIYCKGSLPRLARTVQQNGFRQLPFCFMHSDDRRCLAERKSHMAGKRQQQHVHVAGCACALLVSILAFELLWGPLRNSKHKFRLQQPTSACKYLSLVLVAAVNTHVHTDFTLHPGISGGGRSPPSTP